MFTETIAKAIAKNIPLTTEAIEAMLEVPPEQALGDYAFPCFTLAKEMKQAPQLIAQELAKKLCAEKLFTEVKAVGPYVNIFLKREAVLEAAFTEPVFKKTGKTIIVESSSPNIAKPFGIGHLRSTVIGAALYRTYAYAGWNTISENHLGDWGTQFGKLIAAYKRWPVELGDEPIKQLLELYVKFHEEAEKNPDFEDLGREEFRKLEQGDKENVALWKRFRELSLKEFEKIYARMNVSFDHMHGESFYEDKMAAVVEKLRAADLLEESDGAQIVRLDVEDIDAPAIILKSDGSTIYMTRDLAALLYRKKEFKFDRILYEVGNEQSLHFKQLFAIIKRLGNNWWEECRHVAHGLYRFPEGKMSTRRGKTIFIEDVFEQAVARTRETIEEKNPGLADKDGVAEMVGVGAIIFNDLKNDRFNDILFNWEELLDFEGETGPYLMYTHARLKSILRKSGTKPKMNLSLLSTDEEYAIAKHLLAWPETINKVLQTDKPHNIARYVLDLAQMTNAYYQKHRIIQDDKALEAARLSLIALVAERIKLGLSLLGVGAPEEM